MKERRLLYALGWVKDEYIEEMQQSNSQRASKKRIWLIAAAIAVALLLVGCAVVYFWLQDMSIGTDTYTKTHDDQGQALEEPVEVERQVLTFVGYSDSPTNQAAREWYAFCESYDLNHELMANNPDMPGIENNYKYVYGCYTPEMVDKLDEIVEYEYFILDGYKRVSLDYLAYNKSTVSWQTDLDGTTIPEAEAQAILAKYIRIDQGMKPIRELMTE